MNTERENGGNKKRIHIIKDPFERRSDNLNTGELNNKNERNTNGS
jgi:hypothetical protein